jgi:hypothetical protein
MPRFVRSLLLAASVLPAATAVASTGVGPFAVPSSSGRLHVSTTAHLEFPLPPGWHQVRGSLGGTKDSGSYQRTVDRSDGSCILDFQGLARAQRRAPVQRGDELVVGSGHLTLRFRIEHSGYSGPLHWYLGRSSGRLVAVGVERTPRGFAPRADSYTVAQMLLGVTAAPKPPATRPLPTLRRACTRARDRASFLPSAIKRARLVRNR